jgi:hypothetical protein
MVILSQTPKHFHTLNKNTTQKLKDITSLNEIQLLLTPLHLEELKNILSLI